VHVFTCAWAPCILCWASPAQPCCHGQLASFLLPPGTNPTQPLQCAPVLPWPADHIVRVAEAVADNLQAEISAGDRLRDLLQPRRRVRPAAAPLGGVHCAWRQPSIQQPTAQPCGQAAGGRFGARAARRLALLKPFVPGASLLPSTCSPSPLHLFSCPARPCSGGMSVEDLAEAIKAAERYPSLQVMKALLTPVGFYCVG